MKGMSLFQILFGSLCVAFSMFSVFPVPHRDWKEENMRYMLCFFPWVGVVIGVVMALFMFIAHKTALPALVFACIMTALPPLLTGGIHIDGYCDTVDAIGSHAAREKKLEIMDDPHVGSSAVLWLIILLLFEFSLYSSLGTNEMAKWALLLTSALFLARTVSALFVLLLPPAKKTGLGNLFSSSAAEKKVLICLLIYLVTAICVTVAAAGWKALVLLAVILILCAGWARILMKVFGGMTGDLAGFTNEVLYALLLFGLILLH